jgi:MFS family permease
VIGALRQRDFALLWLGQLISLVGDWVLIVGLPIFVYLLTRSVLATSLMLLAARVPSVALGAIAGLLVDRWDRRRTLIAVNLLLALGLLPLLLVQSADRIWIVYGVALVESCLVQFVSPAANALLPTLVKEEDLVAANSLNSLSGSLGRLVGPALGGIIGAWFALGGVALADAASFALAATLIALVTPGHKIALRASDAPPPAEGALTRIWNEWRDGLRVIAAERVLTTLLGILTITALGEGVFGVLYPVFVSRVLHGAALEVGQLMSAQAIGVSSAVWSSAGSARG